MKIAALLALLWLGALPAPSLIATWNQTNTALVVARSEGCLVLTGGGLADRALSDIPCDASPVLLPAGGVDHLDTPVGRERLELRRGETVVVWVAVPPRRWEIILPLVTH